MRKLSGSSAIALLHSSAWVFIVFALPALAYGQRQRAVNYDEIVDAFIAYDVGELRGEAGARAYAAFQAINSDDAIPALTRGVNRAASINNSCPIIVLSSKLQGMLQRTQNVDMVAHAFDNLDTDTEGKVYGSYVKSLKQFADQRYAALTGGKPRLGRTTLRGGGTASQLRRSQKPVEQWAYEDLVEALGQEKDAELIRVLEELRERRGAQYTSALTDAVQIVPEDMKAVARGLLAQRLIRMTDETLRAKLEHPDAEVRAATARAIGYKESPLLAELAAAIRDREPRVAQQARASLMKLTGQDIGPPEGTESYAEWYAASKRWEQWVAAHGKTPVPPESP
ncbi:MAG: hypothetical protein KDA62_13065 [Planctomycetales bacterium]|nr:hypothetical protein [Planctomycetales bacterium]